MRTKVVITLGAVTMALSSSQAFALFGEDLGPLLQLVAGQTQEIERLAEAVGVAKDQMKLLSALNSGIERTVSQIQSLQSLISRVQDLDPKQIKSIADLNDYLDRVNDARRRVDEILALKIAASNVAIRQVALQSDTAYKMGQEMTVTGAALAQESQSASPGRAAQISAASTSAQMLAQGVELQTLAQMAQVQAMSLDLQKSQVEHALQERRSQAEFFEAALTHGQKGQHP